MFKVFIQNSKFIIHNSRGGFTLVEMAITATIMIIASSILIVFSQGSGNRLTLATEQAKIAGVMNRAKSLALQRYRTEGVSACGFAFRFNDPIATYGIAPVLRVEETGECADVQPDMESFDLNRNIMFEGGGDVIIFESPYLTTRNPQTIRIFLRETPEDEAGIEVTSGGAILSR